MPEPENASFPQVSPLLDVKIDGPWQRFYADEWLPVTFHLKRTDGDLRSVRLHALECDDTNVVLDIDMFQHGIVLRPDETYRFKIPVMVK